MEETDDIQKKVEEDQAKRISEIPEPSPETNEKEEDKKIAEQVAQFREIPKSKNPFKEMGQNILNRLSKTPKQPEEIPESLPLDSSSRDWDINRTADHLLLNGPQLSAMLAGGRKGRMEFVKLLISQYDLIMNQKKRAFTDKKLDIDGQNILNKYDSTIRFLTSKPSHEMTIAEKTKEVEMQRKAREGWAEIRDWMKEFAEVVNCDEALGKGAYFFMKAEEGDNFAVDYSELADLRKKNSELEKDNKDKDAMISDAKELYQKILDKLDNNEPAPPAPVVTRQKKF